MAPSDDRDQATSQPSSPFPNGDPIAALRRAFDRLPDLQRAAIRLAVVERLTVPDIAGSLERDPAEVRTAMRDGLVALREVLDAFDPTVPTESESDAVNA